MKCGGVKSLSSRSSFSCSSSSPSPFPLSLHLMRMLYKAEIKSVLHRFSVFCQSNRAFSRPSPNSHLLALPLLSEGPLLVLTHEMGHHFIHISSWWCHISQKKMSALHFSFCSLYFLWWIWAPSLYFLFYFVILCSLPVSCITSCLLALPCLISPDPC